MQHHKWWAWEFIKSRSIWNASLTLDRSLHLWVGMWQWSQHVCSCGGYSAFAFNHCHSLQGDLRILKKRKKKTSLTLRATPVFFLVEPAETSLLWKKARWCIQRAEGSLTVNIIFQCSDFVTCCGKCSTLRVWLCRFELKHLGHFIFMHLSFFQSVSAQLLWTYHGVTVPNNYWNVSIQASLQHQQIELNELLPSARKGPVLRLFWFGLFIQINCLKFSTHQHLFWRSSRLGLKTWKLSLLKGFVRTRGSDDSNDKPHYGKGKWSPILTMDVNIILQHLDIIWSGVSC